MRKIIRKKLINQIEKVMQLANIRFYLYLISLTYLKLDLIIYNLFLRPTHTNANTQTIESYLKLYKEIKKHTLSFNFHFFKFKKKVKVATR